MPEASLDALLAHAPVGIGFLDGELRVARANDALVRMIGSPVEQLIGRSLRDLVHRPELTEIAAGVLASGVPVSDVPISAPTPGGDDFHGLAGYYPVLGPDGAITGVGVLVRDVTDSVRAEAERDALLARVTRLQRITGALAAARTMTEVAEVVIDQLPHAADAEAVSLCNVAGSEIEVLASDGYAETSLAPWRRFSLDAPAPLAEAVMRGVPVVAASRAEIVERWPALRDALGPGREAVVALPMLVDGVARGAIGLSFARELALGEEDLEFLMAIATQCAGAFHRVRLHEASEAAADRLAFLADAGDLLAASLDWTETMQAVTELAVPRLADIAAVFAIDEDRIRAVSVADRDPALIEPARSFLERWLGALDEDAALGSIARSGEAAHREALLAAGFDSVVVVPLRAPQRTVGLLVLADRQPRELTDDDLQLARELAARAGQAVVNAELFRERSAVAATLQASLLPPATPTIPDLDVASRFFALGEGVEVGGDFYDVFRLGTLHEPDHRWALVIGDVRGKGTVAATVSGAARHAIRSAALHERSPAVILERLNELLLVMAGDADLEPRFCTIALAVIDPAPTGAEVVLACAGHPAPMILRADGSTEVIATTGTLLGVLADPGIEDVPLLLGRGDALVLYTDGVTERHAGTRFFDEDGLQAVLSRCSGFTAPVLAERIETASRAFVEDAPRDDVAVLVARVPADVAVTGPTSADLPSDLTAPGMARRFVAAALSSRDLDELCDTAALLASELVTNAVVHGEGPLRISIGRHGDTVRVEVSDAALAVPKVQPPDLARTHGRGMAIVESFASRWGAQPLPGGLGKVVWFELHTGR